LPEREHEGASCIRPQADRGRPLTIDDIRALELGAAILGTGGGGNPYIGRLRTEQLLKSGCMLTLLDMDPRTE
jgi:DUF917 family protein